jgi:hypothetical protein
MPQVTAADDQFGTHTSRVDAGADARACNFLMDGAYRLQRTIITTDAIS